MTVVTGNSGNAKYHLSIAWIKTTMNRIVCIANPQLRLLLEALSAPFQVEFVFAANMLALRKSFEAHAGAGKTIVVDLAMLAKDGQGVGAALQTLSQLASGASIVAIASSAEYLDEPDIDWLTHRGATYVMPNVSAERWPAVGQRFVDALNQTLGTEVTVRRAQPFVRSVAQTTARGGRLAAIGKLEAEGIVLADVLAAMSGAGGVEVADRTYKLRSYPECWRSDNATSWFVNRYALSREKAVLLGQALQHLGTIYHVVREQTFADETFFFRFARYPVLFSWSRFLAQAFAADGFEVQDRTYHAKKYPATFVGSASYSWMLEQKLTPNEAMTIGQRMIDLSLIHHVADEHPFQPSEFFYRAYAHEGSGAPATRAAPLSDTGLRTAQP
jgi:hypothetical protein